jgi:Ca-activated chloride channel family protein
MQSRERARVAVAAALVLTTLLIGGGLRRSGAVTGRHTEPGGGPRFSAPRHGPVAFTGQLDRTAVLRGGDGVVRLELAIAADGAGEAARPRRVPTDVVVVLDRSGSMGGEKIAQARAAVAELVHRLGDDDRFALVAYADEAALAIPPAPATAGARAAWLERIAALEPAGGTNMSGGLDLALDTVERTRAPGRVPRVVLLSDGLANQGDASPEGLVRRAGRAAAGEYVLSAVGVGADFNEYLMRALADAGTGNYYWLASAADLGGVFTREFEAARTTVAGGLAVAIEPADGVRVLDAAGYPLERAGGTVTFRPGALFAGQERRVWVTLAVPSDTAGERALGRMALTYTAGGETTTVAFAETPRVACVADERDFFAQLDGDTWTRGMLADAAGKLEEDVARAVKDGRREDASRRLEAFRRDAAAMNARVQSPPVAAQLEALGRLEAEVADAFTGAGQDAKQNAFSKAKSADAVEKRRAGAKR